MTKRIDIPEINIDTFNETVKQAKKLLLTVWIQKDVFFLIETVFCKRLKTLKSSQKDGALGTEQTLLILHQMQQTLKF